MKKKLSELDFDLSLTSVWEDLFPKDSKKKVRRGSVHMSQAMHEADDAGDGENDDLAMNEEKSPGKPGTPGKDNMAKVHTLLMTYHTLLMTYHTHLMTYHTHLISHNMPLSYTLYT